MFRALLDLFWPTRTSINDEKPVPSVQQPEAIQPSIPETCSPAPIEPLSVIASTPVEERLVKRTHRKKVAPLRKSKAISTKHERTVWTQLYTPETWQAFSATNGTLTGIRSSMAQVHRTLKPGDYIVAYVTGIKRWCGLFEVRECVQAIPGAWLPNAYPLHVKMQPLVRLNATQGIPLEALEGHVSWYRDTADRLKTYHGIFQRGFNKLTPEDAAWITARLSCEALNDQRKMVTLPSGQRQASTNPPRPLSGSDKPTLDSIVPQLVVIRASKQSGKTIAFADITFQNMSSTFTVKDFRIINGDKNQIAWYPPQTQYFHDGRSRFHTLIEFGLSMTNLIDQAIKEAVQRELPRLSTPVSKPTKSQARPTTLDVIPLSPQLERMAEHVRLGRSRRLISNMTKLPYFEIKDDIDSLMKLFKVKTVKDLREQLLAQAQLQAEHNASLPQIANS